MKTEALFVTSAAAAHDLPADGTPELAVVGRSNVGKSTLINALTGLKLARTSATPGKTRLVNVFRVAGATARPFYLVDLPGFGYAKGSRRDVASFAAVTDAYFASLDPGGPARGMHQRRGGRRPGVAGAILLVDARHPGLANDVAAFGWLAALRRPAAVVATKIDKLTRAERSRAQQALDRAFHGPVLTVSAATGEGMKELWKLIDRLLSNQPPTLTSR